MHSLYAICIYLYKGKILYIFIGIIVYAILRDISILIIVPYKLKFIYIYIIQYTQQAYNKISVMTVM